MGELDELLRQDSRLPKRERPKHWVKRDGKYYYIRSTNIYPFVYIVGTDKQAMGVDFELITDFVVREFTL